VTEEPGTAELEGEADEEGLLLYVDPGWQPTEEQPGPPMESILGAWPTSAEGDRGRFHPNPVYRPISSDSPLDPVDAVLRTAMIDYSAVEQLPDALRDVMLGIAVDESGAAVVRPSPDDIPSVLVATAYGHRARLDVPQWREVTIQELAAALPDQGVDVLINPGSGASMRLVAAAVRDVAGDIDPR
jgi:hypothetical protein